MVSAAVVAATSVAAAAVVVSTTTAALIFEVDLRCEQRMSVGVEGAFDLHLLAVGQGCEELVGRHRAPIEGSASIGHDVDQVIGAEVDTFPLLGRHVERACPAIDAGNRTLDLRLMVVILAILQLYLRRGQRVAAGIVNALGFNVASVGESREEVGRRHGHSSVGDVHRIGAGRDVQSRA